MQALNVFTCSQDHSWNSNNNSNSSNKNNNNKRGNLLPVVAVVTCLIEKFMAEKLGNMEKWQTQLVNVQQNVANAALRR